MDPLQRQQQIRALAAHASREDLLQALLGVLEGTVSAQRGIDYDGFGIGQWRGAKVAEAEYEARAGVGDSIDTALLTALRG
ncbi:hypothetical protein AB0H73_38045 [Streptomyces olivoreticuli]